MHIKHRTQSFLMLNKYNFQRFFAGGVVHYTHEKIIVRYNVTQDNSHDTKTFIRKLASFGCNSRTLCERICSIYYYFFKEYQTNQVNKE